jgi:hypothetical protein
MRMTATTPTFWWAWRRGANGTWRRCAATLWCVQNDAVQSRRSEPSRCWRHCPDASGAPCAGGRGVKAGCAKSVGASLLARDIAGGDSPWLVAGRASRSWASRGTPILLEQPAGVGHLGRAGGGCPSPPCHGEATGELGWDQYEGRLWPGFHRHAVSTMLASSFLLWQELRQRQHHPRRDRPRDPVAPSAGSVASYAACRASGGALWLRHQALLGWMTTDRFMELCSLRF